MIFGDAGDKSRVNSRVRDKSCHCSHGSSNALRSLKPSQGFYIECNVLLLDPSLTHFPSSSSFPPSASICHTLAALYFFAEEALACQRRKKTRRKEENKIRITCLTSCKLIITLFLLEGSCGKAEKLFFGFPIVLLCTILYHTVYSTQSH